ncbi:MAG: FkbM family methyltransferase [Solirubrobacteraceae bacterium]|nr:FkbM family methyltransferase [Solirubrobacteraceae bacterium]
MALLIAALLERDDDAIDVGAHQGDLMRQIISASPQGRHLAVEPLPSHALELRAALPHNVIVEEYALTDTVEEGEMEFLADPHPTIPGGEEPAAHLAHHPEAPARPQVNGNGNGNGHHAPNGDGARHGYVGGNGAAVTNGNGNGHLSASRRKLQVRTISLDALVDRHSLIPRLIRIDVDGSEGTVLDGARRTIRHYQPVLLVEHGTSLCHGGMGQSSPSFFQQVSDLGLRIFDLDGHGPYHLDDFVRAVHGRRIVNYLLRH